MRVQILKPSHVHKDGVVHLDKFEVMLTENHEVLMRGVCPVCGVTVDCYNTIEELWKMCPLPEEPKFTIKDISDLKMMNISLPT